MKRIPLIVGIIILVLGAALLAQQANCGAEQELKLAVYVGQWKYEGEYSPSFSGTPGKVTGEATGAMILSGHFLEWRWIERGPGGEARGLEILGYDPVNKNYPSRVFGDDGSMITGVYTLEKGVSRFSAKMIAGGKEQLIKVTEMFGTDLKSFRQKAEVSDDGRTWTPMFEGRFTKEAEATLPMRSLEKVEARESIQYRAMSMARFGDGKIAEMWMDADFLGSFSSSACEADSGEKRSSFYQWQ